MELGAAGILALLVYLPIFLFMLKKDFRERFNKINSRKKVDLAIEFFVGILYFMIIVFSFFQSIKIGFLMVFGAGLYIIGLILTYRGYYYFYVEKGLITKDIFAVSRNPTYFFGFVAVAGIALLTHSWAILILVVATAILTHRIILNEERYLAKEFGKKYSAYCENVRRYI